MEHGARVQGKSSWNIGKYVVSLTNSKVAEDGSASMLLQVLYLCSMKMHTGDGQVKKMRRFGNMALHKCPHPDHDY